MANTILAECEKKYQKMTPGRWFVWATQAAGYTIQVAAGWIAVLSAKGTRDDFDGIVTLVNAYPALRDEITRLRSLIARTVVVMDGSWDMLPPHEQDRLAAELRRAALGGEPTRMSDLGAILADDARYGSDDDVRALAAVDGASGALAVRHRRRLLKLIAERERQGADLGRQQRRAEGPGGDA